MLVIGVLNGYSASSRARISRTSSIVDRLTREHERIFLGRRSSMFVTRSRLFRKYIHRHENPKNALLLVGKSFGAYCMVTWVLNHLKPLRYRKTGLVTIDPCWPTRGDWTPNLNDQVLPLTFDVNLAINLFAPLPRNMQAGSLVSGENVMNQPVENVDHFTITTSTEVREAINSVVDFLLEPEEDFESSPKTPSM